MSNLTDDELNRLLLQLIDQTDPDRPSDDESSAVVRWAEGVRIGESMLEMVLIGDATVRIIDGKEMFKLTPQGIAAAKDLVARSPEARALHDRLTADSLGKPLSKGPDGQQ